MALIGEIVVDDEGGFVGQLTDRDIVIRVTAEGGDARTATVAAYRSKASHIFHGH